jgi:DNA-binding response OmpR family regulator
MSHSLEDRQKVLVVDADRVTFELLHEWLAAAGIAAVEADADPGTTDADCALALVDVAFPRDEGLEVLRRVAAQYPHMPILAMSPGFFSNVECTGPCARQLGVAGVLPKPVARDALVAAVRELLPPR